jgi:hypothetical protein
MIDNLFRTLERALARFLAKPFKSYAPVATITPGQMAARLVPLDVLLWRGTPD